MLVVPLNSLDKWYDRFIKKYNYDPNFVYKTTWFNDIIFLMIFKQLIY
jgi:hypothetical protein